MSKYSEELIAKFPTVGKLKVFTGDYKKLLKTQSKNLKEVLKNG